MIKSDSSETATKADVSRLFTFITVQIVLAILFLICTLVVVRFDITETINSRCVPAAGK